MDFRHLIVTCLFSMLRLSFETQKIKENYAIFKLKNPCNSRNLRLILNLYVKRAYYLFIRLLFIYF